jgi:hypothetical protein
LQGGGTKEGIGSEIPNEPQDKPAGFFANANE